jgi:hypothetical protein
MWTLIGRTRNLSPQPRTSQVMIQCSRATSMQRITSSQRVVDEGSESGPTHGGPFCEACDVSWCWVGSSPSFMRRGNKTGYDGA